MHHTLQNFQKIFFLPISGFHTIKLNLIEVLMKGLGLKMLNYQSIDDFVRNKRYKNELARYVFKNCLIQRKY